MVLTLRGIGPQPDKQPNSNYPISNLPFHLRTFSQQGGKPYSEENNCFLKGDESHTNCAIATPSRRPIETDCAVCSSVQSPFWHSKTSQQSPGWPLAWLSGTARCPLGHWGLWQARRSQVHWGGMEGQQPAGGV